MAAPPTYTITLRAEPAGETAFDFLPSMDSVVFALLLGTVISLAVIYAVKRFGPPVGAHRGRVIAIVVLSTLLYIVLAVKFRTNRDQSVFVLQVLDFLLKGGTVLSALNALAAWLLASRIVSRRAEPVDPAVFD
jgi:hypothetical protein